MNSTRLAVVVCLALPSLLCAQKPSRNDNRSGYDRSARATLLHPANVYVAPDVDSQRAALVNPGHEVVIAERSGPWVRVFANTDVKDAQNDRDEPEFNDEDPTPASGWIKDKGIVTPTTPNGDAILFGAAANLEAMAAEPHAPVDAASEAHLLYRRAATYFPQSPLAAEAAWRSADIRWQIDKRDQSTLPSAKEQDASLRPGMFDGELKRVMKAYPNTPQAAKAAFELIDNKLCGDWQGLPKCPEMESNLYEKYASQFPGGPRSAEALYDAAFRQGSLVAMYEVEENRKKSAAAAAHTQKLAEQIRAQYPQSDFTPRAEVDRLPGAAADSDLWERPGVGTPTPLAKSKVRYRKDLGLYLGGKVLKQVSVGCKVRLLNDIGLSVDMAGNVLYCPRPFALEQQQKRNTGVPSLRSG